MKYNTLNHRYDEIPSSNSIWQTVHDMDLNCIHKLLLKINIWIVRTRNSNSLVFYRIILFSWFYYNNFNFHYNNDFLSTLHYYFFHYPISSLWSIEITWTTLSIFVLITIPIPSIKILYPSDDIHSINLIAKTLINDTEDMNTPCSIFYPMCLWCSTFNVLEAVQGMFEIAEFPFLEIFTSCPHPFTCSLHAHVFWRILYHFESHEYLADIFVANSAK